MQVVLWDLDGTLADTEELHFESWQASLGELGITYTYAQFIESFGRRNGDILPELLGQDTPLAKIEAVSDQKEHIFRELLRRKGLHPLPGVMDWLQKFQSAGWKQVISSSAPMANIVTMIDALRVGDFFVSLMSGARMPQGKPHPAIFLHSAAAVNMLPDQCLVIEDSLAGLQAARRAGMRSVAVGKVIETPGFQAFLQQGNSPVCRPTLSLTALQWKEIM